MVKMDAQYLGELRCRTVHGPSKAELVTDAPVDNHGRGEAFSPTDTLATALVTCMLTVMGILAKKSGWSIEGATGSVEKIMTSAPPRRVAELIVEVRFPAAATSLGSDARSALEEAAEKCPVRLSLGEAVTVRTRYLWGS